MTKVTLLGDSIRLLGYGTKLPEMLGENFTVYQPADNGRYAKYTLRGVMHDWKKDIEGSDIIHWNNGLWDILDFGEGLFTPIDEYVAVMTRITDILKKRADKVIFATTTPITERYPYAVLQTVIDFNNALVPELKKRGIIINDLFSLVYPNMSTFIKDDNIHLTEAGIDACAHQVKDIIIATLDRDSQT